MKKFLCLVLCLMLMYAVGSSSVSVIASEEPVVLSLMSEDECVEFVKENGILLPAIYDNELDWGPFIKQVIMMFEKNPNIPMAISNATKVEVAEEIRALVKTHYGITAEIGMQTFSVSNTDVPDNLTQSAVYATWNDYFLTYDCYGFAIETYEDKLPGFYDFWSNPPADLDPLNPPKYAFDVETCTIEYIVGQAVKDLVVKGKERIYYEPDEIATDNLCINETIICVRKGPEDYHFMRYTPQGWLHKPGQTQILRYLNTPTNDEIWTNEHVALNEVNYIFKHSEEEMTYYDSTIYFISYNGHDWSYANNNNMTHTKTCSICDDVLQDNCHLSYDTYLGDSLHNGSCTKCNYSINGVYCSYSYTSNNNGTHKRTCTLSDHETPDAACTYTYVAAGNGTHVATCVFCDYSVVRECDLVSNYAGSGAHILTCSTCDYDFFESCTAVLTYCGDATSGDVHAPACKECGNPMGGTAESCTFEYLFTGTINGNNVHSRICTECDYVKIADMACVYKNSNNCTLCGQARDINSGVILKVEDIVE